MSITDVVKTASKGGLATWFLAGALAFFTAWEIYERRFSDGPDQGPTNSVIVPADVWKEVLDNKAILESNRTLLEGLRDEMAKMEAVCTARVYNMDDPQWPSGPYRAIPSGGGK